MPPKVASYLARLGGIGARLNGISGMKFSGDEVMVSVRVSSLASY